MRKGIDYTLIKAYLDANPGTFSGMSDTDAASNLSAPDSSLGHHDRNINFLDVLRECSPNGGTILNAIESFEDLVPDVKWAMYAIKTEQGLNLADPVTQSLLTYLVNQSGELSQTHVDSLNGMLKAKSWAEVNLSRRELNSDHIAKARSL